MLYVECVCVCQCVDRYLFNFLVILSSAAKEQQRNILGGPRRRLQREGVKLLFLLILCSRYIFPTSLYLKFFPRGLPKDSLSDQPLKVFSFAFLFAFSFKKPQKGVFPLENHNTLQLTHTHTWYVMTFLSFNKQFCRLIQNDKNYYWIWEDFHLKTLN